MAPAILHSSFKKLRYRRIIKEPRTKNQEPKTINLHIMTILIDIGNSTIVVAVADSGKTIRHTWRFKTLKEETSTYFRGEILSGLNKFHINISTLEHIIISSVVPEVNDDITQALADICSIQPHFFRLDDALRVIDINIESPSQLGKDRLADAIGAATTYGTPAIIFDMGTATTVGVVDDKRGFIGGMIIPGVKTSLRALSTKASQLPCITIERPRQFIGRNTLECMQSGIVYGTASMVDGIIDRISANYDKPVHVVATGGMAKKIIHACSHKVVIDEYLQFKGLLEVIHNS